MKLPHRRQFLHLAAGAAALPAVSPSANAQAYPTRPVRLIVGYAAGGTADLFARIVAQALAERIGGQIIIENRAGGGSNLAAEAVIRAPNDGYTLLLVTGSNAYNTTLYDKLTFNFVQDVAPVGSIDRWWGVMEVHPSFPAKTVAEFIAYAKANPGKINYGSGGSGSGAHLFAELFKSMAGVNLVHVPYRGGGPAMTDLLGGQVQVMFMDLGTSIEHIKAGRLRALAVTTATRSELLPDVPTIGEFVPGYEAAGWHGIGAPKNTPAEIVVKLNKEINAVLADPKMKGRLVDLGAEAFTGSPAEFGELITDETEKWGKVIRAANIKPE
jgi:tripartite-type tricarboxylate transporter receptor subunit TctC